MLIAGPALSQTVIPRPGPAIVGFTFVYSTGATNSVNIDVTALSSTRQAIPYARFDFWLSNNPTGGTLTATAAAGAATAALTIAGSSGFVLGLTTAGIGTTQTMQLIGDFDGTTRINVLDSGKTLWFPVAYAPDTRVRAVGTKLTAANYAMIWTERFNPFEQLAAVFLPGKRTLLDRGNL